MLLAVLIIFFYILEWIIFICITGGMSISDIYFFVCGFLMQLPLAITLYMKDDCTGPQGGN